MAASFAAAAEGPEAKVASGVQAVADAKAGAKDAREARNKKGTKEAPALPPLPGADAPAQDAKGGAKAATKPDAKGAAADALAAATREASRAKSTPSPAAPAAAQPASATGDKVKTLSANPVSAPAAGSADRGQPQAPAGNLIPRDGDTRTWATQRDRDRLWSVIAYAGAERSSERYLTGYASHTHLGIDATRAFSTHWMAVSSFDYRASQQPYVINVPGAINAAQTLDEQRYDFKLGLGYDYGPRLLESGRLVVMPTLAIHYAGIRNKAFPTDLFGPQLGARVRFELSSAVILHLQLGYTYNLSVTATQSALGAPKGDFGTRAGLALPLSSGYALELDYVNDILAFENVYRVAHGAALGFGYIF